jgi:hypothetical protein
MLYGPDDKPWHQPHGFLMPDWLRKEAEQIDHERMVLQRVMDLRKSVGAPLGVGETITVRIPPRFRVRGN